MSERMPIGRWVRHGLVLRWEGERPRDDEPPGSEAHLWTTLAATLAKPFTYTPRPRVELCACGCLILAREACPACLVWAIRDAIAWSWRADELRYTESQIEEREAA